MIICEEIYENDYKKSPRNLESGLRFLDESSIIKEIDKLDFDKELYNSVIPSDKADILRKLLTNSESIEGHRILRAFNFSDDAARFFKTLPYEKNISNLPLNSSLVLLPWSGYWWAIRYGLISLRYSDDISINTMYGLNKTTNQIYSLTWQESIKKYIQNDEFKLYTNTSSNLTAYSDKYLSASEKYDLLLMDTNFTLTKAMKAKGNRVAKTKTGDIEEWMGICHGWSIASYMEQKPIKPVELIAADNVTKIIFNIDDIKALSSAYWAEARYISNFAGYRCSYKNVSDSPVDNSTGLYLDYSCFGLNPASFHIILTNQIGRYNKSLIFEPTVDNEVWNHPVYGFKADYYNPVSKIIRPIDTAKISISEANRTASNDPFINFVINKRANATEYLVGVRMKVDYVIENSPSKSNAVKEESKDSITYLYILELDKDMNIIGGEWRFNYHANYVWGPREGDEILYAEDRFITNYKDFSLSQMLPFAKISSGNRNKPLRAIIKQLIKLASS